MLNSELYEKRDFNAHFTVPQPPQQQVWQLPMEKRKALARDPRCVKELDDDAFFKGLTVELIWDQIKQAASYQDGWWMDLECFTLFCKKTGMLSEHLAAKLFQVFDKNKDGRVHAMVFVKSLNTMIGDDSPDQQIFIDTAYDVYDRALFADSVPAAYFTEVLSLTDPDAAGKKGKKKKKKKKGGDEFEVEKQGRVTYAIQTASRKCLTAIPRPNPSIVTRADFRLWWKDPELVVAFAPTILEVVAHLYHTGDTLPKLPKAFYQTLEPTSEVPFSDADWWLLKEFEQNGYNPAGDGGKKKKGKGKGKKK